MTTTARSAKPAATPAVKKAPAKKAPAKKSVAENGGAEIGARVRRERERAGLSVRQLARELGVSASFLSQFELGQSRAAVNTLFAIATALNLSLDELLGHAIADVPAAPAPKRRRQHATAHLLDFQTGVRWEVLADLGQEHVEYILTEYDPGADSAPADSPQQHRGNDYGWVLEGTLTVIVNGRRRKVSAGNPVAMRGDVPHRLLNETDKLVRAIWFIAE